MDGLICCLCPVCDHQMTVHYGPPDPTWEGPVVRYWSCDRPACLALRPGEVIERLHPDED